MAAVTAELVPARPPGQVTVGGVDDGPFEEWIDPPFEWVLRIVTQAKEAGCRVHLKPNLRKSWWLDEYPEGR